MKKLLTLTGVIVAGIVLSGCGTPPVADDDTVALASCLTEGGWTMYGTEWCGHCKDQKSKFASAFEQVTYVDCDVDAAACTQAGVEGYPTRVGPEGQKFPGAQELQVLKDLSSC